MERGRAVQLLTRCCEIEFTGLIEQSRINPMNALVFKLSGQ